MVGVVKFSKVSTFLVLVLFLKNVEPQCPCVNGVCVVMDPEIICECDSGYSGTFCNETIVNRCQSNPCLNNGICSSTDHETFKCYCQAEFKGLQCETRIPTQCSMHPCENNGICIPINTPNVNPNYACVCLTGFRGVNCEIKLENDLCKSEKLCQNGGTCVKQNSVFSCVCPKEFTGPRCETKKSCEDGILCKLLLTTTTSIQSEQSTHSMRNEDLEEQKSTLNNDKPFEATIGSQLCTDSDKNEFPSTSM